MKNQIMKKMMIIMLVIIQLIQLLGVFSHVEANIKEGDVLHLLGDHECDSLVEYWMQKEQKWSYKIVWYVYYKDPETGLKYPAFCIEPAKAGVGTGYDSYDTTIRIEKDNRIWRILNKGYMGSNYQDWNLEYDDDFYSATKIALHSLAEGVAPKDKYILGNRSVDGNTIEEIRRRGEKALNVAQTLYEYGVNGSETYVSPQVRVKKQGTNKIETIEQISYYIQDYQVIGNKMLQSYQVDIQNFPSGTKIFNSNNQQQTNFTSNFFKVAIPVYQIKQDIKGTIQIKNAQIKTNPIFYCNSSIPEAQSYITYMSGYEKASTSTILEIKANNSSLEIQKIDKETKNVIANVTFEVKDEKGNILEKVTTNQNGVGTLSNLYPQMVSIKEIKVPEPYVLATEEKQVKLEYGKKASVMFENERKKGNLKIVKVDAENQEIPLENVEFELYDSRGTIVKKLITNKKGEAYVNNLEIGTYTLKETKTKADYHLTEDRKIEIEWKQTTEEKVENKRQKGRIEVYKVDAENEEIKLKNVEFQIWNDKQQLVETILTNQEGYAITKELPIGKYVIKETKTNEDYILSEEITKVEVKYGEVEKLEFKNEKIKGKIKIIKISENDNLRNGKLKGSPIEGVLFEIKDEKGQIVETLTTNAEGITISKELEKGSYTIKEIKSHPDYEISTKEYEVKIEEHQKIKEITITNSSKELEKPKLPRTGF